MFSRGEFTTAKTPFITIYGIAQYFF